MRIKFFVFLLVSVFVLSTFAAETQQSGSGSLPKPAMEFKSWQVGRGSVGSEINNIVHTSFITSTETECRFTASVGYKGGNQPQSSVSPIDPDTVVWSIVDPNHGMALADGSLKHNWSGSHPSKLSGTTSFNVIGKLNVPEYKPTPKPAICRDENNHRRHERTPTHRGNTKLAFKIKFTARTEAGQTVSEVLPLKQYDIDQVRQEYVDLNRMIPARVDPKWVSQDTYDFGHYPVMLNAGLYNYHQKWVDAMNKRERQPKSLSNLAISDFTLNSGYRNPHHNRHHARSTGFSTHMYGYALNVDGRDLDDIAGADQQKMVNAAYAIPQPNRARFSQKYANKTHVHADWAWSNWYAFSKTPGARAGDPPSFSLPPQSTDQPVTAAPAPPAPVPGDCGTHTIPASQVANHASTNFACGSHTYYACQTPATSETNRHSHQTLPCGSHSGYRCTATSNHTQTTTCPTDTNGQSCSYGSYYACSPHTHAYPELPADPPTPAPPPPAPTTVACGGAPWTNCPGASSRKAHHIPSCSHCNNGY